MNTEGKRAPGGDAPKGKANNFMHNSAFAAGGFAAGATSASAVEVNAAESVEEEPQEEVIVEPPVDEDIPVSEDIPAETEVIVATDEGLRVAQVDDDASFAEAFADARRQVGAGGVFEWNGKVYNTFYKEEWDAMSESERADFQHRVDYDDVSEDSPVSEMHAAGSTDSTPVEMIDETGDSDVEVIVGEIDGMDAAIVNADGTEMLLVDVDNDGTMDVLIADVDNDGYISEDEGVNISSEGVEINDLYAMQNDDVCYASNDTMPDYMNSADTGMYQA